MNDVLHRINLLDVMLLFVEGLNEDQLISILEFSLENLGVSENDLFLLVGSRILKCVLLSWLWYPLDSSLFCC